MLHLIPQAEPDSRPVAYAEAVSRLASVRHALRLVNGSFAGPAPDCDNAIAAAWDEAGAAKQRSFDCRSARLVSGAAAGLEALLAEREGGRTPHAEASEALVDEIRRELQDVAGVILK
jgi:hypothetical protein